MELCRWLRWKTFYGRTWGREEDLRAQALRNDVPCSCLRTCQMWGPDDDVVGFGECSSDRRCFEPSPVGPASSASTV